MSHRRHLPLPDLGPVHRPGGLDFVAEGKAFEADVSAVSEIESFFQDPVVVDFTGSWFVSTWMISYLQIPYLLPAFPQPTTEIAFADLHVVEIPIDFDVRRVDLLANTDGSGTSVETVTFVIDPDVHGLERQHHLETLGNGSGELETGDDMTVHFILGHSRLVVATYYCHQ